jgi:two-component system KDP operon response regulator KdpE
VSKGPAILVIDDDVQIRRFLRLALSVHHYEVEGAATAADGLALVAAVHPDLVILDLGLPDRDGFEALGKLREWNNLPVIVLSVRGDESTKVRLLDAGANDYLVKPFGLDELLARIRVALRSRVAETADGADGVVRSRGIAIDFVKRIVTRDGVEVRLTPTEYSLLRFLASHAGKVVTHQLIMRELWGPNVQPDSSYLRVYMRQLRQKLEEEPADPRILLTEPGIGYRFIADA